MKTLSKIIVISILILLPVIAFSQTLKMSVYSASKLSSKGASFGVQLPGFIGDIELGTFYETYTTRYGSIEQGNRSEIVTNTKGIYTSFSLVSVKKWDVNLGAKIGTAGAGVVINPSLGADYYVNQFVAIGLETKLEVMKPVLQAKLIFNVFGAQNRLARQSKYAKNKAYFKSLRRNRY